MSDTADDGDDDDGTFTHRQTSAANAPPVVKSAAMSSPFAWGEAIRREIPDSSAPAVDETATVQPIATVNTAAPQESIEMPSKTKPAARKAPAASNAAINVKAGTMLERAMRVWEACGPLTVDQLAEAMNVSKSQAQNACSLALAHKAKLAEVTKGDDGRKRYGLTGRTVASSGFKNWLTRQGEQSAEAPRKSVAATTQKKPPVAEKPRPVPAAPLTGSIECGLFNTGELQIVANEQRLKLSKIQVRELVAYLDLISTALAD